MIVDICEKSWFESCRIMRNEKGEEYIGIGGTGGPENIEEIVDQWGKKRVFAAFSRFFGEEKDHRDYFKSKHYKSVKKSSQKGSRMLEVLQ